MTGRLAAAVVCAALAWTGSASAGDGGAGTYTTSGSSYDFDLANTGTTTWQLFYLVAPPGTVFVGGAGSMESSPRCVVGMPDGGANEIECGPLAATFAPSGVHAAFIAFVAAPLACGAPFVLYVSSNGATFTRGADITFAGSCAAGAPRALTPPVLRGVARVGMRIRATPPAWSAAPTRVAYRWQRCTKRACTAIAGADGLVYRLGRADAGHAVRLVATATIAGATVVSPSRSLPVSPVPRTAARRAA